MGEIDFNSSGCAASDGRIQMDQRFNICVDILAHLMKEMAVSGVSPGKRLALRVCLKMRIEDSTAAWRHEAFANGVLIWNPLSFRF